MGCNSVIKLISYVEETK